MALPSLLLSSSSCLSPHHQLAFTTFGANLTNFSSQLRLAVPTTLHSSRLTVSVCKAALSSSSSSSSAVVFRNLDADDFRHPLDKQNTLILRAIPGLDQFGKALLEIVMSVLMKLSGGCPSMADQLNVDAFLEQARSYDKASSSPTGWYIRNAQTRQLSHPLPVLRAREIDEWSRGRDYTSLLKRGTQNSTQLKV